MKIYSHSLQGKRPYQEDRLYINTNTNTFVVVDGMGGHANGDKAAESVVEGCSKYANLDKAFRYAADCCELAGDYRGAVATGIQINTETNTVHIAHAGDSRMYLISDDDIQMCTIDHAMSWGGLTNCIGAGIPANNLQIDDREYSLEKWKHTVLCTDGVSGALPMTYIKAIVLSCIKNGSDPAQTLCELAIEGGSTDNCTAIVITPGETNE